MKPDQESASVFPFSSPDLPSAAGVPQKGREPHGRTLPGKAGAAGGRGLRAGSGRKNARIPRGGQASSSRDRPSRGGAAGQSRAEPSRDRRRRRLSPPPPPAAVHGGTRSFPPPPRAQTTFPVRPRGRAPAAARVSGAGSQLRRGRSERRQPPMLFSLSRAAGVVGGGAILEGTSPR